MRNKFFYIKKLILISPVNFFTICLLLVVEMGILSFTVLSLVPLVDYILDPSFTNKSRITEIFLSFLAFLDIKPSFFIVSFFFITLQLLKATITIFLEYSILKFKYDVLRKINTETLQLLLNSNWNFFTEINYGYLTNTFVKEINNIGNAVGQLARMFASFIKFFMYLVIPLYINFEITASIILLIALVILPVLKFSSPLSYKFGKLNTQTANYMMSAFSEILQSLKFILINSRSKFFKDNFINAFNLHVNATFKQQLLAAGINSLFQPIGILLIIIVFGIFASRGIILSEVIAIFYSLISVVSATNALIGINISINNFIPSYDQLDDIINKAKKFQRESAVIVFEKLNREIKFDNVTFGYNLNTNIINNISIQVRNNSLISIIGRSGSGKSTLMDLLTGLLKPTSGQILVDGIDLEKININTFREKLGYVNQETTLFDTTILNNLQWVSSTKFTIDEIWQSLEFANLKNFIKNLPNGLNTSIGERGVQLSGGQRQRLSLARAFLKKPKILILDEATSSLDSLSEAEIQKSISFIKKNTDATIIVIAHRLSTVKYSDKILVIDEGMLIEEGTYNSLKNNKDSHFNKMLKNQIIN